MYNHRIHTVLAIIANNQFDKQTSSILLKKGVLDCQNGDVHVKRKLNVLNCQHMLFGNLKRLFWQPRTQL